MSTNGKTHTRVCAMCGKVMHNVHASKMYCPECGVQRKKLLSAQWWARHNEEIRSTRPKQDAPVKTAEERDIEFRADCRAADKAGLSYGQYMLQKNKKPAGVGAPTSCCKG